MDTPLSFRRADVGDANCLSVLAGQVFLDTYATQGIDHRLAHEVQHLFAPATLAAALVDPQQAFWLAEQDAHMLGYVALDRAAACPLPDCKGAELTRLYVLRRFQRMGLGRQLCALAQQQARDWACPALWLTAWSGNAQALAFYQRLQFRDIGATFYQLGDQSHENRVLRLPLR